MTKNQNEINHYCVICGAGYHACDSCEEVKSYAPWRRFTDSASHFKIYQTIQWYNNSIVTKKEAKEMLEKVDLSDMDSYLDGAKSVLSEILSDGKRGRRKKESVDDGEQEG